jgi:hypothetical protein
MKLRALRVQAINPRFDSRRAQPLRISDVVGAHQPKATRTRTTDARVDRERKAASSTPHTSVGIQPPRLASNDVVASCASTGA